MIEGMDAMKARMDEDDRADALHEYERELARRRRYAEDQDEEGHDE